jgi:hypothetical protein
VLAERGLLFVGIDVIGDWLTEINVTSPTCMVEIAEQTGFDAAADVHCRAGPSSAPLPDPAVPDLDPRCWPAAGRRCIIRNPSFSAPASRS